MPVVNTTSPTVVVEAPKPTPSKRVPSSRNNVPRRRGGLDADLARVVTQS